MRELVRSFGRPYRPAQQMKFSDSEFMTIFTLKMTIFPSCWIRNYAIISMAYI